MGAEYVVNTSELYYKKNLSALSAKLKPSSCLECISGDTTGEMLDYLGFKSTLILYGLLSDKPAGNISVIQFIGKA